MLIYIIYKYLHMCSVTMCARLFPDWLALFLVKCNICPCLRQGQKLVKLSVGKWEPHKHVSFFWLFAYCAVNYEMILPSECVHWPCHLGDTHSTGGAECIVLNGRMVFGRGTVSLKIMQFWLLPPANCRLLHHKHVASQPSKDTYKFTKRTTEINITYTPRRAQKSESFAHIYECGKQSAMR